MIIEKELKAKIEYVLKEDELFINVFHEERYGWYFTSYYYEGKVLILTFAAESYDDELATCSIKFIPENEKEERELNSLYCSNRFSDINKEHEKIYLMSTSKWELLTSNAIPDIITA